MEVQLYVYDLTRGMARAMSQQFLGIQIDAVYHTAVVFGGVEYFFGAGVQTCYPGSTHHGQPMEIVPMGTTDLPMDTIMDYLESLKEVYTHESYDLFEHNCNNFTSDFAMFLVGKDIPDHITNLPRRVLETPFGQMLKPRIDASMRSITQAPVSPVSQPASRSSSWAGPSRNSSVTTMSTNQPLKHEQRHAFGSVVNVTSLSTLNQNLAAAKNTASTIFFTSSTCAPCRIAYPVFDQLADQYLDALFVKVDINAAHDIALKYQIRATPTFMTFARGVKQNEWAGADPNLLKSNVNRLMLQMFPPHPHSQLESPTLQFGSLKPVLYARVPPLDKLTAKLGSLANNAQISSLRAFIETRNVDAKSANLPKLVAISKTYHQDVAKIPLDVQFAAIDLLRCAMIDPRVSGFFAEEQGLQLVPFLVSHVTDLDSCPHNLRLVTIHLACNLFSSPLYAKEIMQEDSGLTQTLVHLITSSLLEASHPTARVASASLAFNMAVANYRVRREERREGLDEGAQLELAASLIETLSAEENVDAIKSMLLALGYLAYFAPENGEVLDLCRALDGRRIVSSCQGHDALKQEVAGLL